MSEQGSDKRAEPSYRQISGIAESLEAIDEVISVAERTIRIFDRLSSISASRARRSDSSSRAIRAAISGVTEECVGEGESITVTYIEYRFY